MIRGFSLYKRLEQQAADNSLNKKERAKAKLLTATYAALDGLNGEELRVADIAKRANVSHGLFYHYFDDRHAAVIELLTQFLMRLQEDSQTLPRLKSQSSYQRIFADNLFYIDCCLANQPIFHVLITDGFHYPEVKEIYTLASRDWSQRIARSLSRAVGESSGISDRIVIQGYCLAGMIDDLMRQTIVVGTYGLRHYKDAPVLLTESISLLWHRSVYGEIPAEQEIALVREEAETLLRNNPVRT